MLVQEPWDAIPFYVDLSGFLVVGHVSNVIIETLVRISAPLLDVSALLSCLHIFLHKMSRNFLPVSFHTSKV